MNSNEVGKLVTNLKMKNDQDSFGSANFFSEDRLYNYTICAMIDDFLSERSDQFFDPDSFVSIIKKANGKSLGRGIFFNYNFNYNIIEITIDDIKDIKYGSLIKPCIQVSENDIKLNNYIVYMGMSPKVVDYEIGIGKLYKKDRLRMLTQYMRRVICERKDDLYIEENITKKTR